MNRKWRLKVAKTQKNEGFYARLVKITNTFVQKPLIFAPNFESNGFLVKGKRASLFRKQGSRLYESKCNQLIIHL